MTAWRSMTETELQAQIRAMCNDRGLPVQHIGDSLAGRIWLPGWPDLVIFGTHVLWRELKNQDEIPSRQQRVMRDIIRGAGGDWDVWRPVDLYNGIIELQLDSITAKERHGTSLPVGVDRMGAVVRAVGIPGPRHPPAAAHPVGLRVAAGGNQRRVVGPALPRGGVLPVAVPAHGVRAVSVTTFFIVAAVFVIVTTIRMFLLERAIARMRRELDRIRLDAVLRPELTSRPDSSIRFTHQTRFGLIDVDLHR